MKEILETILQNFVYVYPGVIFYVIYLYISGGKREDEELVYLKIFCISYVLAHNTRIAMTIVCERMGLSDRNMIELLTNAALLCLSVVLPLLLYRLLQSKWLDRFLKQLKIPISTSRNIFYMIEQKRPEGAAVYATVYLENTAYSGILVSAESEEGGFLCLSHWKKYSLTPEHQIDPASGTEQKKALAVIPVASARHYYYTYVPLEGGALPGVV